jgi:hypothetical protein
MGQHKEDLMLTRLRDQIGTAGLVVAVIALVAALGGGAYAASKGLNSTQKKEVKKIAKSFQGTGPAGAPGAAGAKGDTGAKGDAGAAGAAGVSPAGTKFTGNKNGCPDGGIEYKGATTNSVCNGEKGDEGDPWTLGGTLPEGATLTGIWGTFSGAAPAKAGEYSFPISFPIPLASPPERVVVKPGVDKSAEGCPGVVGADINATPPRSGRPTADPGKLCIYIEALDNASNEGVVFPVSGSPGYIEGAGEVGALLNIRCTSDFCSANGTWAVTAP